MANGDTEDTNKDKFQEIEDAFDIDGGFYIPIGIDCTTVKFQSKGKQYSTNIFHVYVPGKVIKVAAF